MEYKDIIPDQPIAEGYNSEERELDVPDFPQGEQKVKTVKVEVEDIESGEKVAKKLGEYQGELSPNPGYGEGGETKDATKIHLVKGEVHVDGGKFVDQNGIRVEREPVNYVGGLYVKGKPVNPEEGSDDSNVYRFAVGEVMTDEIAGLLKSGDVLLVNNMAFTINKINSDHAWFRGFYTDGSVEGKITVAQLEWENTGDKKLAITFNEVSADGGTKLYMHKIMCKFGEGNVALQLVFISTNPTPITSAQFLNATLNTIFNPIITVGIAHPDKTDLCIPNSFEVYFKSSDSGDNLTFTLYAKIGNTEYEFKELDGTDTVTEL